MTKITPEVILVGSELVRNRKMLIDRLAMNDKNIAEYQQSGVGTESYEIYCHAVDSYHRAFLELEKLDKLIDAYESYFETNLKRYV